MFIIEISSNFLHVQNYMKRNFGQTGCVKDRLKDLPKKVSS